MTNAVRLTRESFVRTYPGLPLWQPYRRDANILPRVYFMTLRKFYPTITKAESNFIQAPMNAFPFNPQCILQKIVEIY